MRLTVVFALVLFFSGITGKFRWTAIDRTTLVVAAVVLAGGLALLMRLPTL